MTAGVKLRNESAMGVYLLAWASPSRDGKRCDVTWAEGMGAPQFSFYSAVTGAMTPPRPIVSPERFGWKPPGKIGDFKAFVQKFADAMEAAAAEDDR